MNKQTKKPRNEEMYKAILTLKNIDECISFFDDLCTITELQAMEQRFQVAALLNSGCIYNEILEKTGASSATISRVNRSLQYGQEGYSCVFKRLAGADDDTSAT
ncbi:MAG: YerC/YecD family TrpR-related protein [Oscillospiraceae bacterium]